MACQYIHIHVDRDTAEDPYVSCTHSATDILDDRDHKISISILSKEQDEVMVT